jgi:hypothetical protein
MLKIFIAQAMTGLTPDEVNKQREIIFKAYIQMAEPNNMILIDQFNLPDPDISVDGMTYDDLHSNRQRIALLGRSIMKLAFADVVIFAGNWEDSDGAKIEHQICLDRGISIIEADDLKKWMAQHREEGDNYELVFPELGKAPRLATVRALMYNVPGEYSLRPGFLGVTDQNTLFKDGERLLVFKQPVTRFSGIKEMTVKKFPVTTFGYRSETADNLKDVVFVHPDDAADFGMDCDMMGDTLTISRPVDMIGNSFQTLKKEFERKLEDFKNINVVKDRYCGTYSNGMWSAWPCENELIPGGISTDDVTCARTWAYLRSERKNHNILFGIGDSPEEAMRDLIRWYERSDDWENINS